MGQRYARRGGVVAAVLVLSALLFGMGTAGASDVPFPGAGHIGRANGAMSLTNERSAASVFPWGEVDSRRSPRCNGHYLKQPLPSSTSSSQRARTKGVCLAWTTSGARLPREGAILGYSHLDVTFPTPASM